MFVFFIWTTIILILPTPVCTMQYYSAIEKNKILPFLTAWANLVGAILSKISQSEKDECHTISRTCGIQRTKWKQSGKHREWTGGCQREEGLGAWMREVKALGSTNW